MTKKDRELLEMMKTFKKLNDKEQGFVFGLAQGFAICKPDLQFNDDANISKLVASYK